MTAPSAARVLAAVKASGVRYVLETGWDDPDIAAAGHWQPGYVIEHHTANSGAPGNAPSLGWVLHDQFAPIRACHFLVARDGTVHVIYAHKCYHAGKGGPGSWGDGPDVPLDSMNGYAYGIEIESKGTSTQAALGNGYTAAQRTAAAHLSAALLDMMGRSTGCAINHRTWAPHRKNDTLLPDSYWQGLIADVRAGHVTPPAPTPAPDPQPMEDDDVLLLINGKSKYRMVTGDRIVGVSKPFADALQDAGHKLVPVPTDDLAALEATLIGEGVSSPAGTPAQVPAG